VADKAGNQHYEPGDTHTGQLIPVWRSGVESSRTRVELESADLLPHFNERDDHAKLEPLKAPSRPPAEVVEWFNRISAGRERAGCRVLDLGCGKGGTVAWLLEEGFDAYGLDPSADYVANGRAYLAAERLAVLDGDRYPFPDDFFDAVLSRQVFEHVADLGQLAREVARVTKRGGVGLHIFPAKWVVVEPHMLTPLVHWFPKGKSRHRAIGTSLRLGLAGPYFEDRPMSERAAIFSDYGDNNIYYRRLVEIQRVLGGAGLSVDWRSESARVVRSKLRNPSWPSFLDRVAGWAYYNFRAVCLTTVKK